MALSISRTNALPPLGTIAAITEKDSSLTFLAPVDMHLGRYFYAGGYRFHVADDRDPMGDCSTWKTAEAIAEIHSSDQSKAAAQPVVAAPAPAAAPVGWIPAMENIGHREPIDFW